ncbi:MAG: DNA polymerase III subunit alpha [Lachnospiraceae bacterium]|nr:DNA polymerase III subunit alpha [Lachnospiraceae bacterium]
MSFVHLHTHTEYSLLDGCNKIKNYVSKVKRLGMDSAAITDHGVMYGVIEFYKECKAQGIKPIIGCEVYVAPGSRFDREITGGDERYHHLILLAENNTGYSNLIKIVTTGFTEGFYYKPRVDKETLRKYHEGIICTSACLAGEIARDITKDAYAEARKCAEEYREIFGKDNYFLEMQDHGYDSQKKVNAELLKMSRELDIPLVVTNDCHYTDAEDAEAHDILLCLQTGKRLSDENRLRYEGGQFYVKSEEEMRMIFPYALEAIENTQLIADRCNVEIEFGATKLPRYVVPEGYTSWEYLNKLCLDGLHERYGDENAAAGDTGLTYRERLEHELAVIKRMGYVDYFLIVWDYINYAKEHGIPVGPGRGSAAGSMVSYCMKITNIDPIKYNLLFERFLNPERVSMPDIDVDFDPLHRQDVIDYVVGKYGSDSVVQIVTFQTLAAKGVIRDVGRVMDLSYGMCDSLAKMVPNELNITIDGALKENPELKKLYENDETVTKLINMCKQLEGLPRNSGMHAAGVVICPEAADEYVPLSRGADGSIVAQFEWGTLESLGLFKMDFLGLRNLTVINDAVKRIKERKGIEIDVDALDYDDKKVFEYIGTGKTEGIFQLESQGMKNFMKELKPRSLEDIIAGISLYRPGPMSMIPKYIDSKEHPEHISYVCKELEPILGPTYGCIVYQEQVMQIVQELAGYTLGRSDNVRRAMSKKKQSVMEYERNIFIYGNEDEIKEAIDNDMPEDKMPKVVEGCVKRGIDEKTAAEVFDMMIDFANYGFNKSHAACYAVVAYQTAYLKYYYPEEYMAALMTSVIDNGSKTSLYIMLCRSMGIKILSPDVNRGGTDFIPADDGIIYALTAVKGVGRPAIEAIEEERERGGLFKSFQDFINRMSGTDVNKRVVESLIKAGAFDFTGNTRKQMMSVYLRLMDNANANKKNSLSGQMSLFDLVDDSVKEEFEIKMPEVGEYDKEMKLGFEKEVLGIYISGHPLEDYSELWKKIISHNTGEFVIDEDTGFPAVRENEPVIVGGMISSKNIKYTKNNAIMAFIVLEDMVGSVECIVFPKTYDQYKELLSEDGKVFIKGRASIKDEDNANIICEEIVSFSDAKGKAAAELFKRGGTLNSGYSSVRRVARQEPPQNVARGKLPDGVWVQFEDQEKYNEYKDKVIELARKSRGEDELVAYIKTPKSIRVMTEAGKVCGDEELLNKLSEIIGKGNVKKVSKKY